MEKQVIESLSLSLEDRIAKAMQRSDWAEAETLCEGLAAEYGNAGIATMLHAMIDHTETLVAEDQGRMAGQIADAVASRDAATATRLLAEKRQRHATIHEGHIAFMAQLMDRVVSLWGEAGLERMLRATGDSARAAMFDAMQGLPMSAQITGWAKSLRNHLGRIEVTEDEEKYTIRQDPCGSGGKLMRAGTFDGEGALCRVSSQGLTLGTDGLPVYCTHCPVWMVNQHDEWYGKPAWVLTPPSSNEAPCTIHFYKDHAEVPADYRKKLTGGAG